MKKTIIIAVLAFGMNVTAQTLVTPNNIVKATNGSLLLQGTNASGVSTQSVAISNVGHIDARSANFNGADGVSAQKLTLSNGGAISGTAQVITIDAVGNGEIILNDKTTIRGNASVSGYSSFGQQAQFNGGITMNGTKLTGIRADYSDGNSAVNVNQLFAVRDNLRAETNLVQTNLNKTNQNVAANTSAIQELQSTKADKLQVAQDIAKAKEESLAYTDTKVKAVNHKLDLEIEANRLAQKRLDDKINSNDEKINQRVRDLEIKIDNRFNAVMSYVGNEFAAVNNRIEGLGASMVALSAAATSSVYNANKPTNLNIATGLYGRATAIAVGMSHFFNSSTKVSVNWSQGSNTKNAIGIGAGFAF